MLKATYQLTQTTCGLTNRLDNNKHEIVRLYSKSHCGVRSAMALSSQRLNHWYTAVMTSAVTTHGISYDSISRAACDSDVYNNNLLPARGTLTYH